MDDDLERDTYWSDEQIQRYLLSKGRMLQLVSIKPWRVRRKVKPEGRCNRDRVIEEEAKMPGSGWHGPHIIGGVDR